MPTVNSILRNRASRRSQKSMVDRIAFASVALLGGLIILGMFGAFLIGLFIGLVTNDLPPASQIEGLFTEGRDAFPELSFVYDRMNEEQLFELLHPAAESRRWLRSNLAHPNSIPLNLLVPLLTYQDDSFWVHSGIDGGKFIGAIFDILAGKDEDEIYRSIPQRLVEITLLPVIDFRQGTLIRYLKSAALAQALDETYSKTQQLEWYINLADFGNFAFGADAASLLYYGKHAAQLSAGESAMLAALPVDPTNNPLDNYANARENQIFILATLEQRGLISQERLLSALNELRPSYPVDDGRGLMQITEKRLRLILGSGLFARPGLQITSTLDQQLQFELECTVKAYLNLSTSPTSSPEDRLETCSSVQFLPLERGGRQAIERGAIVVLDPTSGEILGSYGQVDFPRAAEAMLNPFSYLTAFSKGLSPATMVLDLPVLEEKEGIQAHGPVRMRSALVGGYPYAAERVVQIVGERAVLEVLEQMGITNTNESFAATTTPDRLSSSLLALTHAYGVIANGGWMAGQNQSTSLALQPLLITKIVDESQFEIYHSQLEQQSILSPSLAYLLIDVLTDSAARRNVFGNANIFELDRVSAVVTENFEQSKADNWTIGFTPERVVGVWVENLNRDVLDGSAELWHAIMEYVSQDAGAQGWPIPSGVRTLEVCDPSGLLPTEYCPNLVEEVFIEGTVPLHLDGLYQEIRVNRETGKLATVFTPWDLVEERLYFLPPSEAAQWAIDSGFEKPPTEYDPVVVQPPEYEEVSISFPTDFAYVKSRVLIRGSAGGKDFDHFRLAFGQGLNPSKWFLIDEQHQAVKRGLLGEWDTGGLEGLFTLQLIAIDTDGTAVIVYRSVTIDNQPPQIESFSSSVEGQSLVLSARATDNIAAVRVDFYLNGLKIATSFRTPFEAEISLEPGEQYEAFARAYDSAGNMSENSAFMIIEIDS